MKHTPGPWYVYEDNTGRPPGTSSLCVGAPSSLPGTTNEGRRPIARLLLQGPQTEDNARLIAAAPAVRDAALDVVAWYYDQIYDGPPGPQDDRGGNGVVWEIAMLEEALGLPGCGEGLDGAESADPIHDATGQGRR